MKMKTIRKFNVVKVFSFLEKSLLLRHFSSQTTMCQGNNSIEQSTTKPIPASELPGPPRIPVLGNLLYIMFHKDYDSKKLFIVIDTMYKQYGPTYQLHMPVIGPIVIFSRPEDVKEMFAVTASSPVRSGFFSLKSVRDNAEGHFFAKKAGILAENKDEWWRVRSKVQGPMLKLESIRSHLSAMNEVSTEFVESIHGMLDDKKEVPEDFLMELYKWALESLGTVSLNIRLGCLAKDLPGDSEQVKLIQAVNSLLENLFMSEIFPFWKIYPNKPYKEMVKAHTYLQRVVEEKIVMAEEILRNHNNDHSRLTLLEHFLKTDSLSRTDVITIILDMFIAGIDTTSHTVGFAIYELSKNKESQGRLQKELDDVLGDGNSPITEANLHKFTYLKACIKETLRLYPIVIGVFRQFQNDVIINNVDIPKGWHGLFSNIIMGSNESLFKRADEFLPERWLKDKPLGNAHPYASLPFSLGTRSCIGRRIAEQEIFVLLAKIFHRYNVDYNYGMMECNLHLVLAPAKPLKFQFTLRN